MGGKLPLLEMRWIEETGRVGRVRQPVFETLAMAPPRLPFSLRCGHYDFARIGVRRFNLVSTQAALTTE
jgi:hypothetical protein